MKRCYGWFITISLLQCYNIAIAWLGGVEIESNPLAQAFWRADLFIVLVLLKLSIAPFLCTIYAMLLWLKVPKPVLRCYDIGLGIGIFIITLVCLWNTYCFVISL